MEMGEEVDDPQLLEAFKAYIVVIYLYVGHLSPELVAEYARNIQREFKKDNFEDHFNAPCMVIVVPDRVATSRIEFFEFYPDANISFKTLHNDFNEGKFQEIKDLQDFLSTLRNPNE